MTDRRILTPVKRNLLDAADYIELYGWHRCELLSEGEDYQTWGRTKLMPSVCMLGALLMVSPNEAVLAEAERTLCRHLDTDYPRRSQAIVALS